MLYSFMAGVEAADEVCLFAGQLPRPADNWKRKQKTNFLKNLSTVNTQDTSGFLK